MTGGEKVLLVAAAVAGACCTLGMWGLFLWWASHGKEVAAALLACAIAIEDNGRRRKKTEVPS